MSKMPTNRQKGAVMTPGKYLRVGCSQHQMGHAVSHTADEGERKNNEVGQLYSPVDTCGRRCTD